MANKYKSKQSAIENVKRLFSDTANDYISLTEAFSAWGRAATYDYETNRAWLSNLMTHLKYHNLVVPVYSFEEGRKKLNNIQLTLEGKRAIGRIEKIPVNGDQDSAENSGTTATSSISELMKMVSRLKKEHPDYEVTFDVKLKGKTE